MRAVEIAAREASGFEPRDIGTTLMQKAFAKGGPLRDAAAEPAEADALEDLFAGAIGSYKNPQSHRNVPLEDPEEAIEIVMLTLWMRTKELRQQFDLETQKLRHEFELQRDRLRTELKLEFATEAAIRELRAVTRLVRACRARIACAASRIEGDDGLVLAHAFCDMVLDGTKQPDGWPLLDLLEDLKRPGTARDRQIERIVSELKAIARSSDLARVGSDDLRSAA
jgi:hypothetical protein